jgi:uncharacterized damage-inducible protein DinB
MSHRERLVKELESAKKLFATTTSVFTAEDATFAPDPILYTVAGHIAHAADTIEWFIEGAFGAGWNLDFETLNTKVRAVESLAESRAWMDRAFGTAIGTVDSADEETLAGPISDTRIMGGAPRMAIVNGIVDHTAHHRGSLAVYARLIGKAPPMLYS